MMERNYLYIPKQIIGCTFGCQSNIQYNILQLSSQVGTQKNSITHKNDFYCSYAPSINQKKKIIVLQRK
jgi:hypothetical protein